MAYENGHIPTSELVQIPARNYSHAEPGYLRADAAASFVRLAAAFEARFGKPLRVISVYRPMERQVSLFKERYTPRKVSVRLARTDRKYDGRIWRLTHGAPVASPGQSNHGLATTCDFYGGIEVQGSPENRWMETVGREHGWDWTEGRRIGEPWHRTYVPALDKHKGQSATASSAKVGGLVVDGKPGPATYRAMQTRLKVKATGVWDLATRRALQTYLGVKADGKIGPVTVKRWQAYVGAKADGSLGPATWRATQSIMGHYASAFTAQDRVRVAQRAKAAGL